MGSIDLTNQQVLQNYIKTLIRDGKGEFAEKKLMIFKAHDGSEYVVPDALAKELKKSAKKADKKEALDSE